MTVIDPNTGELVDVPDRPFQVRVPFLRQEIGAGDVVKNLGQAIGAQPCTPCEERRRRMNARVVFTPWQT